jgi:aspartyl/asparaginyl beta-hydroxylase (cupin superfamily)
MKDHGVPFIDGATDNIIIAPDGNTNYQDTIFLEQSPYLKEVLDQIHCPLLAVRLLKLDAGAQIKEHRDAELHFEKGEIRLHIPVITHDDVYMYLDNERVQPKEGECWYMNFNLPHSIRNESPVNRIHLVIDAVVNDWVKEVFEQPSVNKKEIAEKGYDDDTKKAIIAQLRSMKTEVGNRMADEMEATL